MEPIRILHENVIMDPGGIETQLMRIYRNIDREKVQFDFLLHRTQKGHFDDEIRAMGGRIYYANPFNPFHFASYVNSMRKFFKEHKEYRIMIAHAELALWPLIEAKKAGIPVRICYSHNGRFAFNLKRAFMDFETLFLKKYCTNMFAVSELAADYTFGKKAVAEGEVRLIKNGIIAEDFSFNPEVRNTKRKELKCEDKFLVGHVGRFMQQKNHTFLLDVFAELVKLNPDAHLVLIGEGRLEHEIRDKIKELGIENHVDLLGRRTDVNQLMQAMDCLLFPSLWEGFPNVGIEAQAAALPIYMSTNITKEADFSEFSHMLELDVGAKVWAKTIYEDSLHPLERKDMSHFIAENGYDVKATAKWYEKFYIETYRKVVEG